MPANKAAAYTFAILTGGLAAPMAQASCDLAAQLATLHDAYSDLIEGRGTPREDIGRFVIDRDLNSSADAALVDDLTSSGFYDQMTQLGPVLDDMARLAKGDRAAGDLNRHRNNQEALAETLRVTGCFEAPIEQAEATSEEIGPDAPPPPEATESESEALESSAGLVSRLRKLVADSAPISYAVLGGAAASFAVIGIFIRRRLRSNRARGFPRFPFGGKLPVTNVLGKSYNLVVVDISQGGLHLERPEGAILEAFHRIEVALPGGPRKLRIMWENEHFFGFEFDQVLEEDILTEVLNFDRPKEALPGEKTNSAPEGAVQT